MLPTSLIQFQDTIKKFQLVTKKGKIIVFDTLPGQTGERYLYIFLTSYAQHRYAIISSALHTRYATAPHIHPIIELSVLFK